MKTKGILWAIALFLFVLSGSYLSAVYAVDLKTVQKQRAVESKLPSQQMATQPATVQVTATSIDPMSVQLEPGKAAVIVTVKGSNLDKATQVEVIQAGRAMKEIEARLGPPSVSARQVTLKAAGGMAPGNYQVRISAGAQKIDIPLSLLRVEVKASTPPAAAKPQTVTGQAAQLPNKQTISRTSAVTFKPVDITTEKLTASGKVFKPVNITTETLTASGKVFKPVDITTDKLTASGKVFKPVDITTEKLTATGKVFKPVDITTEKLTASGKSAESGRINVKQLDKGRNVNTNLRQKGVSNEKE